MSASSPAGSLRAPETRRRAAVLLLLGAFAVLCAHGLAWDTPTVDEFAHLPAGYYYWRTSDFTLYPVRTAAAALLALYPVSVLGATPDTLSYFNALAGGQGDRILVEANYDWGQGLKRVEAAMAARHLPEIALAYFGHVDPSIYGIRWHFPQPGEPGLVAISVNFLHGYPYATYANGRILPVPPHAFAWIAGHRRIADLGGGMFLYELGR